MITYLKYSDIKRKIYKVLGGVILAGVALTGLSGCTTTNLSMIEQSDFRNVQGKIYIDPSLTEGEYLEVISQLETASARISDKYGPVTVEPVIIIVGTPENASKYGIGAFPGTAFIAPWETYLVLNQQKINSPDVIAHEFMHAQVAELTGYWCFVTKLPTWLSEGIAMQVDYREHYLIDYERYDLSEVDRITKVESDSEFWTDSKEGDIKNYRAAKAAVYVMLAETEPMTLYKKLQALGDGYTLDDVFNVTDDNVSNNH